MILYNHFDTLTHAQTMLIRARSLQFLFTILPLAACSEQDVATTHDMWAIGEADGMHDADRDIDPAAPDDAGTPTYDMSIDREDLSQMHDAGTPDDACVRDADADGLTDCEELQIGTDPDNSDTDFDGIHDGDEVDAGTDPGNPDTDGDTLTDYEEFINGTNPLKADSDGDGLDDLGEIWLGLDPNDPHTELDDVLDGDLFIAHACDTPHSLPTRAFDVRETTWRLAMPTSARVTQLSFAQPSDHVSVLYEDDDTLGDTAGFITRHDPESTSTQVFDEEVLSPLAQVTESFYLGDFPTPEDHTATPWQVQLRTSSPRSARALRDDLLFALTPLERDHLATPLPDSTQAPTGHDFSVHMTFIEREDGSAPILLLAARLSHPAPLHADEGLLDDWTNTTHLSTTGQALETHCHISPIVYDLANVPPPPTSPLMVRLGKYSPVTSSLRVIQAPRHAVDASQSIELSRHAPSFGFAYLSSRHHIAPSSTSYRPCSSHEECEGDMLCDLPQEVCVWQNPQAIIMHHAYFVPSSSPQHEP